MAHEGRTLADRVALVTGASRGVGRAVALGLASAGARVAVTARSQAALDDVSAELEAAGATALPLMADVTDPAAVEHMAAETERELGPVDVLVNNAGVCEAIGPTWKVDPTVWWHDVEVNLRGPFLCSRAVLPQMLARRSGTIVNVSSYNAVRPDPYLAGYSAAKAALVHFSGSLAAETETSGISVFAIAPGTIDTDLTRHLRQSPAGKRWLARFQAIGEDDWASPDLPARLVVRLASGEANALSGRFLHAHDDLDDLIARADEVRRQDLYTLRLRR